MLTPAGAVTPGECPLPRRCGVSTTVRSRGLRQDGGAALRAFARPNSVPFLRSETSWQSRRDLPEDPPALRPWGATRRPVTDASSVGSQPRLQRRPARLRLELQHLLGKSVAVLIHGALSPPRQLISSLASSPPLGQRNGPGAGCASLSSGTDFVLPSGLPRVNLQRFVFHLVFI